MRIDYFIVSEKLKDRIVACEMRGKGIELDGEFHIHEADKSLLFSYFANFEIWKLKYLHC